VLRLQSRSILPEGVTVGLIGAGSVGVWFLLVDLIAGRPFFTPAILGSAVFSGLSHRGFRSGGSDRRRDHGRGAENAGSRQRLLLPN
jgi:hypothetical protein